MLWTLLIHGHEAIMFVGGRAHEACAVAAARLGEHATCALNYVI